MVEPRPAHPILIQLKTGVASAVRRDWHTGPTVIREGDVICTNTARWLDGLCADSCNGIAVGAPTRRHEEVLAIAGAALVACIAEIRPGVIASTVDAAARAVVCDAGRDYPHHTGHGIGYVRAEPPRITPTSIDVLEERNVIALDPGGYIVKAVGPVAHCWGIAVDPDGMLWAGDETGRLFRIEPETFLGDWTGNRLLTPTSLAFYGSPS